VDQNESDRLLLGSATGSGNPGDADGDVGAEVSIAPTAMAGRLRERRHPSSISAASTPSRLVLAWLEYETTPPWKYSGRAGQVGDARGEDARCNCHGEPAARQELRDHLVDGGPVEAEERPLVAPGELFA
jgi:hypothetical protein